MEHVHDLAISLKAFPFQDRDRIVVWLTEHHGKVTGLAKGGVSSKRFGGALDFLSCSKIHYVAKTNAEMVRIEEAITHHEFRSLHADFNRLTAASFAAEFCLKFIESNSPSRDMFVILSNFLFRLDGGLDVTVALVAFLVKAFQSMGVPPSILRCVSCQMPAHECSEAGRKMFWTSEAGGMICGSCEKAPDKAIPLEPELMLSYSTILTSPFKNLEGTATEREKKLFRILSDFLHHHVPGMPPEGLKSWKLLSQEMR